MSKYKTPKITWLKLHVNQALLQVCKATQSGAWIASYKGFYSVGSVGTRICTVTPKGADTIDYNACENLNDAPS